MTARVPSSLQGPMTRRQVLWLLGASSAGLMLPPLLSGCAVDPVTGEKTLVGMSEAQEISIDKQHAPRQFSADMGAVQDERLNRYVAEIGSGLWSRSHRPAMPYSARVLNANHVNAYTFPAGSMGLSRGIMLEMQTEDELAALLGHEVAHVNARHAAERAGKHLLANVALLAANVAVGSSESTAQYLPILEPLSQIGASALLARYSRDDEREADELGMDYMVRGGHNPEGMVGLMGLLRKEGQANPGLLETMFSSHPMSEERYQTARRTAEQRFAAQRGQPLRRERYMDHTAALRRLKPTVEACQRGEAHMARRRLPQAEEQFGLALRHAQDDYAANVLMAKALMAQNRSNQARRFLDSARAIYPGEAQAVQLTGLNRLVLQQPEAALQAFQEYDRLLPGNPSTLFFMGAANENMGRTREAADLYLGFLRTGAQGDEAQFAVNRLRAWQVIR